MSLLRSRKPSMCPCVSRYGLAGGNGGSHRLQICLSNGTWRRGFVRNGTALHRAMMLVRHSVSVSSFFLAIQRLACGQCLYINAPFCDDKLLQVSNALSRSWARSFNDKSVRVIGLNSDVAWGNSVRILPKQSETSLLYEACSQTADVGSAARYKVVSA